MDALIQVFEGWEKARDEKKTTHAVFFDFVTAFDLVDHKILLTKINNKLPSWLTSWLTSWIAKYLSGREQRVEDNKHSEWLNVIAGVTQGIVLGPALILFFISDMNEYLPIGVGDQFDLIEPVLNRIQFLTGIVNRFQF